MVRLVKAASPHPGAFTFGADGPVVVLDAREATIDRPGALIAGDAVLVEEGLLVMTGTPYQTYFDGAQFVHFMLGPATVALAVPLYRNCAYIKRLWLPIAVSIATSAGVGARLGLARLGVAVGAELLAWYAESQRDELFARGIVIRSPSARGVAEEAPGAYKEVGGVVEATEKAGLARRVARLTPVVCIKG